MIAAEDDQANRCVAQDCKFGGLLYQPRLALRERDGAVALIGDSGDLYFSAPHDRRGLLLWDFSKTRTRVTHGGRGHAQRSLGPEAFWSLNWDTPLGNLYFLFHRNSYVT